MRNNHQTPQSADGEGSIPSRNEFDALAKRLLAMDAEAEDPSGADEGAQFRVCAKLAHPLSSLAGGLGCEALLSRALALTKREVPRLNPTKANNGCVEGLAEIQPHLSKQEATQAETALIANLLQLLSTFIGEALTLRILQDVWPDASFNESKSGKETTA